MNFPFFHHITNSQQVDEQPSVVEHEPESISVEGGEFLDDALRMDDLSARTELCVATGTPENLL